MCELMGMSFAKPVVANVSIQAFSLRSQDNADGWGLAWYPDRSLAMVKQPVRWSIKHTQFLEHYPGLLSSVYVAHVRHRTSGGPTPTYCDTHPFSRELNGSEYCFAHNGTLTGDFWVRPLGRFRPVGRTDSEFLFCLLLAELDGFHRLTHDAEHAEHLQVDGEPTKERKWRWLHRLLLRLNDFGRLNCLLSDGERLIVYHDKNAWKGLTWRNVLLHENSTHTFNDATVSVDLQGEPVNHGVIVATNPLSLEGWVSFAPGELKVLHAGTIEFASGPALKASAPADPISVSSPMPAAAGAGVLVSDGA